MSIDHRKLPRRKRSKIWKITNKDLEEVVNKSSNLAEIFRFLEIDNSSSNYRALKKRLTEDKIDFSNIKLGLGSNKDRKFSNQPRKKLKIEDILVENSNYSRFSLKKRLLKEKLLENICSECRIGPAWNGKSLTLRMDHINGTPDDNRLENLRMLCPNCHSQTDTFGYKRGLGKTKKRQVIPE